MTGRILVLGLLMLLGWSGVVRGEESAEKKSSPFPWRMAIRVGGDWEMDMAEGRSRYVDGAGYDVEFVLPFSRKFALTATYFKRGISYNESQY